MASVSARSGPCSVDRTPAGERMGVACPVERTPRRRRDPGTVPSDKRVVRCQRKPDPRFTSNFHARCHIAISGAFEYIYISL